MQIQIKTPRWAKPLLRDSRYKAIYGGRGSGKSHFFAELAIEKMVHDPETKIVCVREVQRTLSQSVKLLLENKIKEFGVEDMFDVQQACIKTKLGTGQIIFQGMQNHTAESIKSLEGYRIAWVEEAQTFSQRSLDILRPTLRKKDSELWFSWNPRNKNDPVDNLFRKSYKPVDSVIIGVNYYDNPWFPDVLKQELEYDKERDIDKYKHIWLGEYLSHSNARVFKNWKVDDFDTPTNAQFMFGADWGFAKSPTVLIRCYIAGRYLFIDYEAYRVGCDIVDTPNLFLTVPESEKWPIVADSARPETIAHMRKNGFPKMMNAVKGKGSIEDGISFLQGYDIIVHPRCKHTIDELSLYSWKSDPHTEEILNILEDDHNHLIDALRYASESARRLKKAQPINPNTKPVVHKW